VDRRWGRARDGHRGRHPLDLGNVVVGQSKTASTSGSSDVNIQNVTVVTDGGTACAEFSIVAPSGPVDLNKGNQVAVIAMMHTPDGHSRLELLDFSPRLWSPIIGTPQ
jgi:hypothetical protein